MPLFKKAVLLSLLLFSLSGVSILGAAVALVNKSDGLIPQGVSIKGIPVGGLSTAEAARKLENSLASPAENNLIIEGAGNNCFINLADIDAQYDCLTSVNNALIYYNKEMYANQLINILSLRARPVEQTLKISFSREKIEERIKGIKDDWDKPAVDATVTLSGDEVVIIPATMGYQLDFEKTVKKTIDVLSEGNLQVTAAGQILKPGITSDVLAGIDSLLAEFSTTFDEGAVNRSHNIALASSTLNGCLVKQEEIFSLNKRLGPRLADTGYLLAPVFIGDHLDLDIGGGICQVATTLYNAVILADLPVLERAPHPLPVSYVAPGRDATIAGDYLDLKFANNNDTPVYITSKAENGTLTIAIYGQKKENDSNVRITSEKSVIDPEVVINEDDSLPEGEIKEINSGKHGYEVKVYKEVLKNNEVISKTLISSYYLEPENRVILVGPLPKGNEK